MSNGAHLQPYRPNQGVCRIDLAPNAFETPLSVCSWVPFEKKADLSFLWLRRLKLLLQHARTFPAHKTMFLRPASNHKWAIYFCYAPDGKVGAHHKYTIRQLKQEGFSVLVVCAAPSPDVIGDFSALEIDGLIWKALRGYDFSGYTAGLKALAAHVDRADVLVLNDSILGPFHPITPVLESSPWDLTGMVTSKAVENHLVSFSFIIRGFDRNAFDKLRKVFFQRISFDTQGPVSLLQETRLASGMSAVMSVGSLIVPDEGSSDAYVLLGHPKGIVDAGFPFMKLSIFGKLAGRFDQPFYRAFLEELGHPQLP